MTPVLGRQLSMHGSAHTGKDAVAILRSETIERGSKRVAVGHTDSSLARQARCKACDNTREFGGNAEWAIAPTLLPLPPDAVKGCGEHRPDRKLCERRD